MPTDNELLAGQRIVASVRSAFPDDARLIDTSLRDDHFEVEESPHIWLERFSQFTTNAIKRGQYATASEHLNLLSALLTAADEPTIRCIDVAYVESLMWDIEDGNVKHEGWRLIPSNLQSLYTAMWGKQPFMQRTA